MTAQALLLTTGNQAAVVHLDTEADGNITLDSLARALDATHVEPVKVHLDGADLVCWLDEYGMRRQPVEVNRLATALISQLLGHETQMFVGRCVVTAADWDTGLTLGLSADQVSRLHELLGQLAG